MDVCGQETRKKERIAEDEPREYWRCTLVESKTRLRVGRGIAQTETEAAITLWQQVKKRKAHRTSPPPLLSDGWGGHRETLVQVDGKVPVYKGRQLLGRLPAC